MSNPNQLVKIIADFAIFLEFNDEDTLNPDAAVEMMESIAADLDLLSNDEKVNLIKSFEDISKTYSGEEADFVKDLPDTFGLR